MEAYMPSSYWRKRLMQILQSTSKHIPREEINVGMRLQELRIMRDLSQRALANLSGLNFNTLSLIENQKSSPNVSTLQQLARALDVPITAFFESITDYRPIVFQKSGERHQTPFPQGHIEDLGGGLALGEATPLLMTLNPDEDSDPQPITHSGQEFVYCLAGSMVYWVEDQEYLLEPGDSLLFESHLPHRWENPGDIPARVILVIRPSDVKDRSVIQHISQ
jgi:transcriptional regulator with XRE-family HTH domain